MGGTGTGTCTGKRGWRMKDGEDGRESGKRCMVAWMVCERASVRDGALEIVHIN